MGAKAKARRADFRKKQKRAKKEQQRALYESFKKQGTNSKRTKIRNKKARRGIQTVRHAVSNCGNQGCNRCYPNLARQRMNDSNDLRVRFRTLDQIKNAA